LALRVAPLIGDDPVSIRRIAGAELIGRMIDDEPGFVKELRPRPKNALRKGVPKRAEKE
jgi:hypothetical protein